MFVFRMTLAEKTYDFELKTLGLVSLEDCVHKFEILSFLSN